MFNLIIMKVLHLSFHTGCINDIKYVLDTLNIENEHMLIDDYGEQKYNMTQKKANQLWNKYKNTFDRYDCIITSDTTPLCRIFLENNWEKKLIVWVCNRFDYTHHPVIDGPFPDTKYYEMIKNATQNKNVYFIGYTAIENYYCRYIKGVDIGNNIITPIGCYNSENISNTIDNKNIIFVPPYHNDTIMMNLSKKINELGFECISKRYNGPSELTSYKAVVHIPYAWSNLALFESFAYNIVYFIPSINFIYELMNNNSNFWFQDRYLIDKIYLSEWYNEINKDAFIFFDSWEHLKYLINTIDYENHKNKLKIFYENHKNTVLKQWNNILCDNIN